MKRDLINSEGREVVADIVVAVAVFLAQIPRQRRKNAQRRKREQAAIGHFVKAMAVRIVSAQCQAPELLGCAGLQAAIVAARTGAELVDAAESLVERLVVGEGGEAAIAHGLIAVRLHLVWLLDRKR